jgi:hypothetical protein
MWWPGRLARKDAELAAAADATEREEDPEPELVHAR